MKTHFLLIKIITILGCALFLAACTGVHSGNLTSVPSFDDLPKKPILRIENGMHTAAISSISSDAENHFLLTTSFDKTARLWDFSTGKLLSVFRVPSGYGLLGRLECGAISPDGKIIALGGWTGTIAGEKRVFVYDRASGEMIQSLSGIPSVILHLAFSGNGNFLAATTGKNGGLFVWDTQSWSQCFKDLEYYEETHWVDFDKAGRLVTASYDGFVRLYDADFQLITMRGIAGGIEPNSAVFSPDGGLVAVGFNDSNQINVLSGEDLSYLYTPNTGRIGKGSLGAVAWKKDLLYAGGRRSAKKDNWQLIRWAGKGKKPCKKLPIGFTGAVVDIKPTATNRLLFASQDPAFGILKSNGGTQWLKRAYNADFLGTPDALLVSSKGNTVQISFSSDKRNKVSFSLSNNGAKLKKGGIVSNNVSAPRTRSNKLVLTGWQYQNYRHYNVPRVNGNPVLLERFESSWSAAVHPQEQGFVLGTDSFIRVYNRSGKLLWRNPVQTAWAVNISGNGKFVVAALCDGTVRWYNWSTGKELMTLYLQNNGREWVVWTPDGFFDYSAGGENFIGFQINKGWEQAPDFIVIDQMYDSLYRPDFFVAGLLDGNHEYRESVRKVDPNKVVTSGLPPKVRIEVPEARTRQKLVKAKFFLTVEDGGLGRIVYRVNGITRHEETGQRTAVKDKKIAITKELPLEPGKNVIEAIAYNESNKIESQPAVAIVYRVATDREKLRKPDLYVLAVGVDKYRDDALRLHYSVKDTLALTESLGQSSKELFHAVPVTTLLDDQVTKQNMAEVFKALAAKIQPEDAFVLYIAGHGLAVESNYYFLPSDLIYKNEQSVVKQGVSRDDLQHFLAMIPASKSVVLLDTCNAGAFAGSNLTRGLKEKTAVSKLIRATGRATIMASTGSQVAYEGYQGHGVFTWALIEALKGKADQKGNKDGVISVNELAEYVMEEVPRVTMEKWNYEQFPLQDLTGRSFPLGVVEDRPASL